MSAADNIGPHLLGWKPRPYDMRDYRLEDHLPTAPAVTADSTLQELNDAGWFSWPNLVALLDAIKALFAPAPPAPPTPPAPGEGDVVWTPGPISDQGQTPHCVGFTGLDWGNALPVDDQWPNAEGDTIYYACKVVDGEPRAEDGSNTRSLFKVLKQMGRCNAYAFTSSLDTIRAYVRGKGPVAIGIPWDNDMFNPDADNYVHPGGGNAGGHEILVIGHLPNGHGSNPAPSFKLANHWGTSWGDAGFFYMTEAALKALLARGGDAGAGLELPLL